MPAALPSLITVMLVDDRPAVRRGLEMRLGLEPDLRVVGEAGDGEAALALVSKLHPDVVLIDVEMPHMDGIATTAALRAAAPQTAVVILSLYDDEALRARAQAAGAAAFVAKEAGETMLLTAIRQAARQHNTQRLD